MTGKHEIGMPEVMIAALNEMTDEQIATFNERIVAFQQGLRMTVMVNGGMMGSHDVDSAKALIAGAGLYCHLTGEAAYSAAFGAVAVAILDNPLVALMELKLERAEGQVVIASGAPPLDELIESGQAAKIEGEDARDMLRKMGLRMGDEGEGPEETRRKLH